MSHYGQPTGHIPIYLPQKITKSYIVLSGEPVCAPSADATYHPEIIIKPGSLEAYELEVKVNDSNISGQIESTYKSDHAKLKVFLEKSNTLIDFRHSAAREDAMILAKTLPILMGANSNVHQDYSFYGMFPSWVGYESVRLEPLGIRQLTDKEADEILNKLSGEKINKPLIAILQNLAHGLSIDNVAENRIVALQSILEAILFKDEDPSHSPTAAVLRLKIISLYNQSHVAGHTSDLKKMINIRGGYIHRLKANGYTDEILGWTLGLTLDVIRDYILGRIPDTAKMLEQKLG